VQLKIWRLLLRPLRIYWVLLCKIVWPRVRVKLALAAFAIVGDTLMRGVSTGKNQTKADAPIFSPVKQRGKYLETFLLRHLRSDPLPKKPETMGWEPVSCFSLQVLSAVTVHKRLPNLRYFDKNAIPLALTPFDRWEKELFFLASFYCCLACARSQACWFEQTRRSNLQILPKDRASNPAPQ
jgi:hypothetical protein